MLSRIYSIVLLIIFILSAPLYGLAAPSDQSFKLKLRLSDICKEYPVIGNDLTFNTAPDKHFSVTYNISDQIENATIYNKGNGLKTPIINLYEYTRKQHDNKVLIFTAQPTNQSGNETMQFGQLVSSPEYSQGNPNNRNSAMFKLTQKGQDFTVMALDGKQNANDQSYYLNGLNCTAHSSPSEILFDCTCVQ